MPMVLPSYAPQAVKDFATANTDFNYWFRYAYDGSDLWWLTKTFKIKYAGQLTSGNIYYSNILIPQGTEGKVYRCTVFGTNDITPTYSTYAPSWTSPGLWTIKYDYKNMLEGNYDILFNSTDFPGSGVTFTADDIARRNAGETIWKKLTTSAASSITGIEAIADKRVPFGTALNSIGLPSSVYADMSDGTISAKAVTWNSTPSYNGNVSRTYVFSGTVSGTSLTANINVIVESEIIIPTITSSRNIADINVTHGTPIESVGLPATAFLNMSDSTLLERAVVWDTGTPIYNKDTAGAYVFKGTVAGTVIQPSVTVNVAEAEPLPVIITAESIEDKTVPFDTSLSSLALPSTVYVTLSDGTDKRVAVTWDGGTPAYSQTTSGYYIFTGTIEGTTVKAVLNVEVLADKPAPTVISINPIESQAVPFGTILASVPLPNNVYANMSDGTIAMQNVVWDTSTYDKDKEGTYTFTGSTMGTSLTASIDVYVQAPIPTVTRETPPAPVLTIDDAFNTVSGMQTGMEYDLDNSGYVDYTEETFNALDLKGNHTLKVRVKALGNNYASDEVVITLTAGSLTVMQALQKGMYNSITSLGYTIYDYLPDNPVFPHVRIGSDYVQENLTKTNIRYTVSSQIDVFSTYRGTKEAKDMLDTINNKLKSLNLGNEWYVSFMKTNAMRVLGDNNPEIYHGILEIEMNIIQK